ncbi:hypothetical protein pb186bvf_013248 [Paramecium bursaria]
MRKSPLIMKENKYINNQKLSIMNKQKQKTASLEKHSYTNRSLLHNDSNLLTPNQMKKNLTTQASDQKLSNQSQILKSLMKIQSKTNPGLQANCHYHPNNKAKYIVSNNPVCTQCSIEMAAKGHVIQNLGHGFNSLNQTNNPSPKIKTVSLSTYTSMQSHEHREKEMRQERIFQFKNILTNTKQGLENLRVDDLPRKIEKIFEQLIQSLQFIKSDILKQVDRCLNAEIFQIKQTVDSIRKMEDDISQNEFNIVEYMTMGPFNEIISIYQQRFQEHQSFYHQLTNQDQIVTQLQKQFEHFQQFSVQQGKNLSQSLQTYLSLYVSFQNKDVFMETQENQRTQRQNVDNLFQTCETNNSIDEDQVIMKENQEVRQDNTSKFTELLQKGYSCSRNLFPTESPQFKI